jgi:hypothetical protein
MGITRHLFARVTIAYAVAILVVSSVDLSYEWPVHLDRSTSVSRGFGIGTGYVGIWELGSESQGLRTRVHRPDFGFAGVTLIADVPPSRVFLIAPWSVLMVAWLGHIGWMFIRGKRRAANQ